MAESIGHQSVRQREEKGDAEFIALLDEGQPLTKFKPKKYNKPAQCDDIEKRIQGSLIGLAIGDAVGAPVEFRPHAYLQQNEVRDMQSGGTWGLPKGYWTDDTSMMLCLAASLITKRGFDPYDQFQRYRRWYRDGYMSSTGKCFDIGQSTRDAITKFESLYQDFEKKQPGTKIDRKHPQFEEYIKQKFENSASKLKLGAIDAAGNGPLMRLAPLPCFFHDSCDELMKHIEEATQLTHGNPIATDACKFYAGLIWCALNGTLKDELLEPNFYKTKLKLNLRPEVETIAKGSYKRKKNGYDDGIRGQGYVVDSLEAALWAFCYDNNDFKEGVLKAVNLGDDTDTTAAIYGELAGAVYGIDKVPPEWTKELCGREFIIAIANSLYNVRRPSRKNAHEQRSDWDDDNTKDYGDGTYSSRHERSKSDSNNKNDRQNPNNINDHVNANLSSQKDQKQTHSSVRPDSSGVHNNTSNQTSNNSDKQGKSSGNGLKNNHDHQAKIFNEN